VDYHHEMTMLVLTDERFLEHVPGGGHPERPDRLQAVWEGLDQSGVAEDILREPVIPAADELIKKVHSAAHFERLVFLNEQGGGKVDPDTRMSPGSWEAARLAAGAGIQAVAALKEKRVSQAFCAIRPPGHHATPTQGMGFCLLNNVAITAAALTAEGKRVAIVDIDAHHGNGTQDAFWDDDQVLYVSCHQWPLFPGTGAINDIGAQKGQGFTVNVPLPPQAAGDTYRAAFDEVITPAVERFNPDWLLISAGFDAHRDDPLASLGLTSGDYADLMTRLVALVPAYRSLIFLEGGYDLAALTESTAATVSALLGGSYQPEKATSVGPGLAVVQQVAERFKP